MDIAYPVFRVLDHHQSGARVLKLARHLDLSQRGIDRRDGGAKSPGREEEHDELDPVREPESDHVARPDSEFPQLLSGGPRPREEVGIVERACAIGDRGAIRVLSGTNVGELGKVHSGHPLAELRCRTRNSVWSATTDSNGSPR
jgi:hypothetical protein